jgi:hypothetical protein
MRATLFRVWTQADATAWEDRILITDGSEVLKECHSGGLNTGLIHPQPFKSRGFSKTSFFRTECSSPVTKTAKGFLIRPAVQAAFMHLSLLSILHDIWNYRTPSLPSTGSIWTYQHTGNDAKLEYIFAALDTFYCYLLPVNRISSSMQSK